MQNSKPNRLIVTTGAISLLNVLTLIRQTKTENKYNDILLISFSRSKEFEEEYCEIIKNFNFSKIIFDLTDRQDLSKEDFYNILGKDCDSIIIANHNRLNNIFMGLYPDADVYLTEEGLLSYFPVENPIWKNVKKVYMHNYFDKILPLNFPSDLKVEQLDLSIFRDFCKVLENKYPLRVDINESDKNILITSNHNLHCLFNRDAKSHRVKNDGVVNYYFNIVQKFIDLGFNVYFKPHPREIFLYPELKKKIKNNFHIIETRLPIEIYNKKFSAIFSPTSGTVISMSHIWNIPAFSDYFEDIFKKDKGFKDNWARCVYLINIYTENINNLFRILENSSDKKDCDLKIKALFNEHLQKQEDIYFHKKSLENIQG